MAHLSDDPKAFHTAVGPASVTTDGHTTRMRSLAELIAWEKHTLQMKAARRPGRAIRSIPLRVRQRRRCH